MSSLMILLPHVMRFNAGRPEGAKRLKDVALALGLVAPADPVEAVDRFRRRDGTHQPKPVQIVAGAGK